MLTLTSFIRVADARVRNGNLLYAPDVVVHQLAQDA
jgi:hypothetical protein